MFDEPTDILLHKLCSVVIGLLLIAILIVLGIRLISSSSSASNSTYVNGSSNVITGGVTTIAGDFGQVGHNIDYNFGRATHSTGHVIVTAPRPVIRLAVRGARSVGTGTRDSVHFMADSLGDAASFVGDMLGSGAAFIGDCLLNSMTFTINTTSKTVAMVSDVATTSTITTATDKSAVPVIAPREDVAATLAASYAKSLQTATVATAAPAPQQTAPPVSSAVAVTSASIAQASTSDLYAWGNCTWWVSIRRAQVNDPIPNYWGNAADWAYNAERDGYTVNHTPSPGAIMQISDVDYGLGHVAFVESVDPDGTWNISEMNVLGLDVVDHKSEPASAAAYYNFIH